MNKSDVFKTEIGYIKSDSIKHDAITLINLLPDYFFEIPASSTGKYHPSYSLGEMGLVRHTKAVVRIAYELLQNPILQRDFSNNEQDIMILAMIIHDGLKSGLTQEKYTKHEHPLLISEFVRINKDKLSLTEEEIKLLMRVLESHMGPWNTNSYSQIKMPLPQEKHELFVHFCDYIASRKVISLKFNSNNEIIEEERIEV